jgi:cathepsin L
MSYASGILDDPLCRPENEPNHGVVVIGYGLDNESGQEYWLIKNSWGTEWGSSGYVKLARNKNMCNILYDPVYAML